MDTFVVLLLTLALLYVGLAVQTACDLLLDKGMRQANAGPRRMLVMLAKCLVWPLVLLDVVRIDGMMTRREAADYSTGLAEAAAPVSADFREMRQARLDKLKDAALGDSNKNRNKRKNRKKKRKKKRH